MDRKQHQVDLVFKLGLVLSPLYHLVENPEKYSLGSRSKVFAKFFVEVEGLEAAVRDFVRGEAGYDYRIEGNSIHSAFHTLKSGIERESSAESTKFLHALIGEKKDEILNSLQSVPVGIDSAIFDADTPFSTYCIVKELCQTAGTSLVWVDRYFDHTIFHRYLREISSNVNVTLVTWPLEKRKSSTDKTVFNDFLDISRLYALERGPRHYRLLVHAQVHDRWLMCDSHVYQLGGSIKDIDKQNEFTLSKLDPPGTSVANINNLLNSGTEMFGLNQPTHL